MAITDNDSRQAFEYLRYNNANALLDAFHYAMAHMKESFESPSHLVRRRASDKSFPVVRAYMQLVNMLNGNEPFAVWDSKDQVSREAEVRQWAKDHQQGLINLGVAPGKLNPIPEEMAQVLALLADPDLDHSDEEED